MPKQQQVTLAQHQELMQTAYSHVVDPADVRGPIDALVPWDSANVYMRAIEFMTGVKPEAAEAFKDGQRWFRLTCVGYRAGPAGDH